MIPIRRCPAVSLRRCASSSDPLAEPLREVAGKACELDERYRIVLAVDDVWVRADSDGSRGGQVHHAFDAALAGQAHDVLCAGDV